MKIGDMVAWASGRTLRLGRLVEITGRRGIVIVNTRRGQARYSVLLAALQVQDVPGCDPDAEGFDAGRYIVTATGGR